MIIGIDRDADVVDAVLDVRTYAVGVEDEAQHGVVTETGADFVQGYYFGLPVSEQEFEEKFL